EDEEDPAAARRERALSGRGAGGGGGHAAEARDAEDEFREAPQGAEDAGRKEPDGLVTVEVLLVRTR
ncbi:MAG: hypothetical protein ACYTG6_05560, partial [Planctomycetota bacterium]